jgi:hypothetical protein
MTYDEALTMLRGKLPADAAQANMVNPFLPIMAEIIASSSAATAHEVPLFWPIAGHKGQQERHQGQEATR